MSLDFAVRYPFSIEARQYLNDLNLNDKIVQLAIERIKNSLESKVTKKIHIHESDRLDDLSSFAAARMILSFLRNSFITNRFAVSESKLAHSLIDKNEHEAKLLAATFLISPTERIVITGKVLTNPDKLYLDIPTFLKFAPKSTHYQLINRKIFSGYVEISAGEKNRLIEEAIRKHIEKLPVLKDPPEIIKSAANELLSLMPKKEKAEFKAGDYPPCIQRLLDGIQKHENLGHQARWYLANFLLSTGLTEDQITAIYSDLPDFSEKITRYQISHLIKKGYSTPSCATVMTYGLCCAICKIGSPLNWDKLGQDRKDEIKIKIVT